MEAWTYEFYEMREDEQVFSSQDDREEEKQMD